MLETQIPDLIGTWTIPHPIKYVVYTALMSLGVRVLSSALKALECSNSIKTFMSNTAKIFGGFPKENLLRDYWFPFFLGWVEIAGFGVLMRLGAWLFIGAWLTFKTLGQWDHWKEHRPAFNRFLIGNALVLMFSMWVAHKLVSKL